MIKPVGEIKDPVHGRVLVLAKRGETREHAMERVGRRHKHDADSESTTGYDTLGGGRWDSKQPTSPEQATDLLIQSLINAGLAAQLTEEAAALATQMLAVRAYYGSNRLPSDWFISLTGQYGSQAPEVASEVIEAAVAMSTDAFLQRAKEFGKLII